MGLSQQQVKALLVAAFECSYYLSPNDPGLTNDELNEAGGRLGLQQGEINDVIRDVADVYWGGVPTDKILPKREAGMLATWQHFIWNEEPEYRDIRAFDFFYSEWDNSRRLHGGGNVSIERSTLTERAAQAGIRRLSIETTIAIMKFAGQLTEKDGILRPQLITGDLTLPSVNLKRNNPQQIHRNSARATAYPIIKDIVARRHDGRMPATEPFDAFAGQLATLGYEKFRLWWQQLVSECRLIDAQTAPVAVTVAAAALVEGCLTFVVQHARNRNLGVMGSRTFEGSPTSWRIDDLVASAAAGKDAAILDATVKNRADLLVRTRQRIHAGRMIADYPGGPPDLRPEEARDAKATAELVVRRVLDWLQKYP